MASGRRRKRTVSQTLYHVAAAPKLQQQIHAIERRSTLEGFDFPAVMRRLIAEDERVQYPAGMSPASKTRFEMLMGVKEHEMHHRAQLMLIERLVGIVPHLTRQMQERMAAIAKAT